VTAPGGCGGGGAKRSPGTRDLCDGWSATSVMALEPLACVACEGPACPAPAAAPPGSCQPPPKQPASEKKSSREDGGGMSGGEVLVKVSLDASCPLAARRAAASSGDDALTVGQ
jgi:hypothetical protein